MTSALLSLGTLHDRLQRGSTPDATGEAQLGTALLLGVLPEDNTDGWTYRTAFHSPLLPPSLDGSGLSAATLCWPVRKQGGSRSFRDVILVGRASSNDVVLAHSQVSKLHARIKVGEGTLSIADAGSSNGTFVNGEPVKKETRIVDGDVVSFGAVVLTLFERSTLLGLLARLKKLP